MIYIVHTGRIVFSVNQLSTVIVNITPFCDPGVTLIVLFQAFVYLAWIQVSSKILLPWSSIKCFEKVVNIIGKWTVIYFSRLPLQDSLTYLPCQVKIGPNGHFVSSIPCLTHVLIYCFDSQMCRLVMFMTSFQAI